MNEPETDDERGITRRQIVRTVTAAGTTVLAPSWVQVGSAATSSGNVELTTTATVPTNTTIDVTVYEDTSGNGTADNSQTKSIPDGTNQVTEYDGLTAVENESVTIWLELALSTSDDTTTPEIDSATITLPAEDTTTTTTTSTSNSEDPPDEPQDAESLWNNYRAFVAGVVLAFAAIGMWGRSLTVGAFLAYMVFAYIAISTGTVLFTNILYVTIVLVFLGFAFKLWRLEFGGE